MKPLYSDSGMNIWIYDDNNYVTFRDGSKQYSYHNKLDSAVREVSRLLANKAASDLHSWLEAYQRAVRRTEDAVEGEQPCEPSKVEEVGGW